MPSPSISTLIGLFDLISTATSISSTTSALVVTTGDIIGSEGYTIYDAHGRLVNWNVTVINVNPNSIEIKIQYDLDSKNDVLPDRSTIELLDHESIELIFDIESNCIPWISLISSDNRNPRINISSETSGKNISISLDWVQTSIIGSSGTLTGIIGCGDITFRNVIIKWAIVPHMMINSEFETNIPYDLSTPLSIPLDIVGEGDRIYTVTIEGPLDRIATIENSIVLSHDSNFNITINPNGLDLK